ncbi:prepilin-type N-terminal cleavage/methylation domain-containing protein [Ligilactobacillus araffinosus]|nr:prepilin-type N-terminal cleavage/methylation domain-containing protein [Ligilactobacillus araffinosus]
MKNKGFTLLETTIVLALACLFLLLSFFLAPRSSA